MGRPDCATTSRMISCRGEVIDYSWPLSPDFQFFLQQARPLSAVPANSSASSFADFQPLCCVYFSPRLSTWIPSLFWQLLNSPYIIISLDFTSSSRCVVSITLYSHHTSTESSRTEKCIHLAHEFTSSGTGV